VHQIAGYGPILKVQLPCFLDTFRTTEIARRRYAATAPTTGVDLPRQPDEVTGINNQSRWSEPPAEEVSGSANA
jgi:hypothetical protein